MLDNACGNASVNHRHIWFNAIPGLQNIEDNIWKEALGQSDIVSFPAGTKLIHCGDEATHFIIVLQGIVRVYQTADSGKEICLYRVHRGEACVLTLTKLLKTKNVCAQADAEEDVRLLAMPVDYFHQLMAESKDFQNYIMRALASCLTESMQMVADVSFQRLELRLACLIGKLCQMKSSNKLKVTHQEIANELGTTREVVSRILKDFEHMGCIQLNRGSIEILSGEALQNLAS